MRSVCYLSEFPNFIQSSYNFQIIFCPKSEQGDKLSFSTNYVGNYSCLCTEGFDGDGFQCENICARDKPCGSNSRCRLTQNTRNNRSSIRL